MSLWCFHSVVGDHETPNGGISSFPALQQSPPMGTMSLNPLNSSDSAPPPAVWPGPAAWLFSRQLPDRPVEPDTAATDRPVQSPRPSQALAALEAAALEARAQALSAARFAYRRSLYRNGNSCQVLLAVSGETASACANHCPSCFCTVIGILVRLL